MIEPDYFGCEGARTDGSAALHPGRGWDGCLEPVGWRGRLFAVVATAFKTEIIVLCGMTVVVQAA